MKQNFYTWNWVGGGYNQTYACNRADALEAAKKIWPAGVVDLSTFKQLNKEEEIWYWQNFRVMD